MANDEQDRLSDVMIREIRRQAVEQAVKVSIWVFVAFFSIAAAGWALYLQNKIPEWVNGVPKGAVTAFDLSDGCPSGWAPFTDAAGRFIVGAGQGQHLLDRRFRSTGGFEWHTLVREELPDVKLSLPVASESKVDRYNAGGKDYPVMGVSSGEVALGGTGKGFETMPPYIALLICKKS